MFIFFRETKMFVSRGLFVVQRLTSPFYVFVLHFPLMCIANCELRYFFRPLLKFMIFVKNPRKIPMTLFIIFSNSKIKSIISSFPVQFFCFFFDYIFTNSRKLRARLQVSPLILTYFCPVLRFIYLFYRAKQMTGFYTKHNTGIKINAKNQWTGFYMITASVMKELV